MNADPFKYGQPREGRNVEASFLPILFTNNASGEKFEHVVRADFAHFSPDVLPISCEKYAQFGEN